MKIIHSTVVAALMVMGTMAAPTVPAAHSAAAPQPLVCDNTRSTAYSGTYTRVRVPEGASCYLRDARVLGNLMARGARDVVVIDTPVERNIKIWRATRDVVIGSAGCRVDPVAGNNIEVRHSHNVAICFMTTGNNILVTRNDGRLMLKRNDAGASIRVIGNYPYDRKPGDGRHPRIGAVRLKYNDAARHIIVRRNEPRQLILVGNSPTPLT